MKTRIRDRWQNPSRQSSSEENAKALAYICWQLALTSARNLHAEDFIYRDDIQRIAVIREYLVFLVHVSDRLAFEKLMESDRSPFISSLAQACAYQFHRNASEITEDIDHRKQFIDTLNSRNNAYKECTFEDGKPGFALLRTFGKNIKSIMGDDQTNRWVIDQVMAIDGPDLVDRLSKSLLNLIKT